MVGDSAYGLTNYMMVPYKDNGYLNSTKTNYNFIQSSTRNVVERTFGIFKARFTRMINVQVNNFQQITNTIMATTVLHNYIMEKHGMDDLDELIIEQETEVNNYVCIGGTRADSERKRDRINASDLFKK